MKAIGNETVRRPVLALAFIMAALFSVEAGADELTVPFTFQSGTRAIASEVNENFAAVEASVDDNAADIAANATAIEELDSSVEETAEVLEGLSSDVAGLRGPTLVRVDGALVGRLLGVVPRAESMDLMNGAGSSVRVSYAVPTTIHTARGLRLLSETGFLFRVEVGLGGTASYPGRGLVVFGERDCVGAPYTAVKDDSASIFSAPDSAPLSWSVQQGLVFRSLNPDDDVSAYYAPKNADVETLSALSFYQAPTDRDGDGIDEPSCTNVLDLIGAEPPEVVVSSVIPLLPNDPAVTGVGVREGGALTLE